VKNLAPSEPVKSETIEDAPGAAAEFVQDDRKSTWEAIALRNSAAIPRWTTVNSDASRCDSSN
jgi:hypothetical protein